MMDVLATLRWEKIAALAALLMVLFYIVRSLVVRDRSNASKINLDDLLIGDDGKVSKGAAVMLGSFAVTSWMMVFLTLNDKVTEGYFASYLGVWVIPVVAKIIKGPA